MDQHNSYDPYSYRDISNGLTNFEALMTVIKSSVGTGALAMPNAFYNAGYLNGLISLVILSGISLYALHILIENMYEMERKERVPVLTYSESMKIAVKDGPLCFRCFAGFLGFLVNVALFLFHFGILCTYVAFISICCKEAADMHYEELDARIYSVIITSPLVLMFLLRTLKQLYLFSVFGNMLFIIGFCILFYEFFRGLPSIDDKVKFQNISNYPLYFGTVLFATQSVGVLVKIESEMEKPQDFLGLYGILNQGIVSVTLLYGLIGFFGYWRYGDAVEPSIATNINTEGTTEAMQLIFGLGVLLTYALQGSVVINVMYNNFIQHYVYPESYYILETILRTIITIVSVIFYIAIPYLDKFLPLVGSFCISLLLFIFPAIMDICIKYHTGHGIFNIYLIRSFFFIIFGITGGAVGTITSIIDLVHLYIADF